MDLELLVETLEENREAFINRDPTRIEVMVRELTDTRAGKARFALKKHAILNRKNAKNPSIYRWQHETDKEWIARGGQKDITNIDAIDLGKRDGFDWTIHTRPTSPEQAFWSQIMVELVKDAVGLNPGVKRICTKCHADMDCGCYKEFKLSSGEDYIRKTSKKPCPKGYIDHTIQDCALWFINNDPVCEEYCIMLGITVSYLREYVKKGEFHGEDYAQQRSGITPKLSTQTLHTTRRSGKTRRSAGPSKMGR